MNENMQPNNSQGNGMNTSYSSMTPVPENKSSIGSIIGTIIVISIIILGGLYFWGKRIDEARIKNDLVSGQNTEEKIAPQDEYMEANAINSLNKSDDLNSIEADLKATNLDNLDAELNAQAQ